MGHIMSSTFTKTGASAKILPCSSADISFAQKTEPSGDETCTITPGSTTLQSIQLASRHLTDLKVPVVMPTETVYGLAASSLDPSAVAQIFSIKGRPADNPLIVHVSSRAMLLSLLPNTTSYSLSPAYEKLIAAFWPGPLTLLFPADPAKIPPIVTAGQPTVAIRMPSHPVARALIAHSNTPLAAPSANTSGKPSPTKAEHVWTDLGESGKVSLILDGGPCGVGVESTVVDGLKEDGDLRVLRPGGVTVEEIERVVRGGLAHGERATRVLVHRRDFEDEAMEQHPTTPGMKYLHYSPSVPVILLFTPDVSSPPESVTPTSLREVISEFLPHSNTRQKVGLMLLSNSLLAIPPETEVDFVTFDLGRRYSPTTTAQRLFDGLLTLEQQGVEMIFVEGITEEQEGLAVMNRLRKAAREVRWIQA